LIFAAASGHIEVVSALLARGAFIETANEIGITPLMFAAQRGHVEIVSFLLAKGAFIEAANVVSLLNKQEGSTPLIGPR